MNIESTDRPSPPVIHDPPSTKLSADSTSVPAAMRMLNHDKSVDNSHHQYPSPDTQRIGDHQIPTAMRMLNQEKSINDYTKESTDNNHPMQHQNPPESTARTIENEKQLPATHNDTQLALPSPSSEINNNPISSPPGLVHDAKQTPQLSSASRTPERTAATLSQAVAQHMVDQPSRETADICLTLPAETTTAPHPSQSEPSGIEQGESTHDSTIKNAPGNNSDTALTAGKSETSDNAPASLASTEIKTADEAGIPTENSSDTDNNTNSAEKTANEASHATLTASADEPDKLPASQPDPESSAPGQLGLTQAAQDGINEPRPVQARHEPDKSNNVVSNPEIDGDSTIRTYDVPHQPSGAGGGWETINERPGGAVSQLTDHSCGSACAEMISNGEVSQEDIWKLAKDEAWSPLIAEKMNEISESSWQGGLVDKSDFDKLNARAPWSAELYEGGRESHAVVIDGVDEQGRVKVRDPWAGGSTYRMDRDEFMRVWNGLAVFRQ